MQLTVDGETFRIRLRPQQTRLFEYDYDWLTGPNVGYGFGMSGPAEQSEDEHIAHIRAFLSGIDPSTGFLRES